MRYLPLVFLANCLPAPSADYAPTEPTAEAPGVHALAVLDVESPSDIGPALKEVVDGINAACGDAVLKLVPKVVDDKTVRVFQSTYWLKHDIPQPEVGEYIGYCDQPLPGTSCKVIHVMDFVDYQPEAEHLDPDQGHRALTHELGHALGLEHSDPAVLDIMNAAVPDGTQMTVSQGYIGLADDLRSRVGICNFRGVAVR